MYIVLHITCKEKALSTISYSKTRGGGGRGEGKKIIVVLV